MEPIEIMIRKALREILEEFLPKNSNWIAKEEAKTLLGIKSDTTLIELRSKNHFRFAQRGKVILYDKDSILEYIDKHTNYGKSKKNQNLS
ncbi:MAG: hypothetical protein ACKVOK_12555 [Flavobacteriales bacterium]